MSDVFGLPSEVDDRLLWRSANGQGCVAGDGPNGHVTFSCLDVVVTAENVTSVAEKEMNGRSESSFGLGMSRELQFPCMRVC